MIEFKSNIKRFHKKTSKEIVFMNHISIRTYLVVLFFLGVFLLQSASANEMKKRVLVLHAYHQGYHWTDRIMAGMKSVFDERDDIELFVSYMDTKRRYDSEYFKQLRDLYATKYEFVKFDAIVSSDDHALDFLLKYRDELFPDTPVIFSGINIFSQERLKGKEKFTGIYESYDVRGTIELMLHLHPETTNITTVSDDTLSGYHFKKLVVDAQSSFSSSVNFNYLDNLSPKDLKQSLNKLPQNSLVIWAIYLRTPKGTTLSSEESVKLVSQSSRFPTYCVWDVVGQGVLGGKITSPNYQGEIAAKTALQILQGKNIEDIPVVGSPLVNIFDYNVMKKYNLTADDIPDPKIFLNKPKKFYEIYEDYILTVVAIAILMIIIITFLVAHKIAQVNNSLEKRVKEEVEKNKQHQKMMILQSRHAQMGEILSMIAHQWRHPLNNLSLIIQNAVFKYSVDKLDDNEISKLDLESSTQIRQMSKTIKEFKNFFSPDNKSVKYDINKSIVDAVSIVKPMLEAENIFLNLNTKNNIFVKGFPTELGQAIVNIITNSKDALVEKNIDNKSIKLSLELIENDVKITIEDNGGGVPSKILEKIFDPYFSTKMDKNGTGLGLYMTKIIVEDHMYGKLNVTNSNNGFVVEIVLQQEAI